MDDGRWTMDDGRWTMDDGRWTMDDGRWTMDDGRWTMDDGKYLGCWNIESLWLFLNENHPKYHFYMKTSSFLSNRRPHQLRDKTFDFALRIIKLNQFLTLQRKKFIIRKQILRSGTNPGAMVREAIYAESGLDFIHKLGGAQKEMSETQYWIELLYSSGFLSQLEHESIYTDSEEIMRQLKSAIITRKRNLGLKTLIACITFVYLFQMLS